MISLNHDAVIFDESKWKVPPRPDTVFTIEQTSIFKRSPEDVFEFCIDGRNYQKIFPEPIEPVPGFNEMIVRHNHVYSFKHWMKHFIPVTWLVYIPEYEHNKKYVDMQLNGFFRYFRHIHECEPVPDGTLYRDKVEFRSYFPELVDAYITQNELQKIFILRHQNMRRLLHNE